MNSQQHQCVRQYRQRLLIRFLFRKNQNKKSKQYIDPNSKLCYTLFTQKKRRNLAGLRATHVLLVNLQISISQTCIRVNIFA